MDKHLDFITYIYVRYLSKEYFGVDFDPEHTDEEIASIFNKLNLFCENFEYSKITRIAEKKYLSIAQSSIDKKGRNH
jgi:hypothetical protein